LGDFLFECLAIEIATDEELVPVLANLLHLIAMHWKSSHQSRQFHAVDATTVAGAILDRLPSFEFYEDSMAVDEIK
jgi:hypothetical protein